MLRNDFRHTAAPTALRAPRTRVQRTLLRYGVRPLLGVLDVAAFLAAVAVVGEPLLGMHLVLLALTIALFASAGLYRPRLSLSVLDDLPSLVGRPLAAAAVTTTAGVALHASARVAPLLVLAAVFAGAVVVLRCLGYGVVRRCRRDGVVGHPTLVLGAGRVGGHVAQLLLDHPEYGLRPVGFVDSDPLLAEHERPIPLLGGNEALSSAIVEFGVHDVIVAFGSAPESQMVDVIRTCDRLDTEIFFVPRLFELASGNRDTDQVWGLPLVRMKRAAFRSPSWRLKRALDVLLAGTALLLLAPVMAVCALAVLAEGGRGIFFGQERVGLDGRPFTVWKFRSMRPRDESDSQTTWSIANDSRVGPVGRILRKTSLDELPQLWNILRGDMSVVGPRPERPHFAAAFAASFPRYDHRHRVPVGLTGWAQVHGLRGDTSIEDRARFDNFYIENWSLWTDVKIVVRTLGHVVRGTGA
ncbi:MAG TPA: sugar transferase [Mycobacteriales bacterium]|jgi:exopolysaccharide biosynthesis polyprenyl glycosylphosphotransferase|nr:sugar transferase [Mycobacteriales bacterium]